MIAAQDIATLFGDVHQTLQGSLALLALCSARLYVALLVIPATDSQRIPGAARNGLVLLIGLYIAWGQAPALVRDTSALWLTGIALKESLIGFMIGYATSTVFWVAESVGSMIDNVTGYNNVQQSDPNSSEQSTPIGHLLSELSIAGFFIVGGMTAFIGMLFQSYTWWPLNDMLPSYEGLLVVFVQSRMDEYMNSVARLAAPILLIMVLIDVGFGLLTKVAEKLEPSGMAQPVKAAVALTLLAMVVGVFFNELLSHLSLEVLSTEISRFFGR